jgi:hypothetical protein
MQLLLACAVCATPLVFSIKGALLRKKLKLYMYNEDAHSHQY